eukprot:6047609-Ditylum_brightwellii.AAC.1
MDTPNYWQAMNRPDTDLFIDARKVEMDALDQLKARKLINIEDVLVTAAGIRCTIIESTWAFKVKQYPDCGVKNRKARVCICCDQQLGLKSQQVDCTNDFVQAEIPLGEEVYMSLPQGWKQTRK